MFEVAVIDPAELPGLDNAALIDAMTAANRAANAVEARKLAIIAEFTHRRCDEEEHPEWGCDDWDAAAAEISCALTVGHGRAMRQMRIGLAMADRLPKVGAAFLAGAFDVTAAATLAERTSLVTDADALRSIDARLAAAAIGFPALSKMKLERAIDAAVAELDPDAVHRAQGSYAGREINIGDLRNDENGLATVWGRLTATDAVLFDAALNNLARTVCDDDPRTLRQRRADAVGALSARADRLTCRCDDPKCPAKTGKIPAATIHVHVVAQTVASRKAAIMLDRPGTVLPPTVLDEVIANGARVQDLPKPKDEPEPRYRPSAGLADFIRSRDMTCRHPGCDRPAYQCDLDHVDARSDGGATHPANLGPRCRRHHLVKTFWPGWTNHQEPDGTLTITTPTGHSYTTKPLSALLFPDWDTSTGPAPPPRRRRKSPSPDAGVMMPVRKTTRRKARAQRIKQERESNALARALEHARVVAAVAEADRTPPPDYDEPPPF